MAKRFLVLQHTPWEGVGPYLQAAAKDSGVVLKLVRLWQEPLPDPSPYAALIVLGGSPNVDQEKQFAFLGPEKEFIRNSIAADRPYLGFCLGHQLLADALGATVADNFTASIGFVQGHLTTAGRAHPVFRGLPRSFSLFKWHGQAIRQPLPNTFTVLATSVDCQFEAVSLTGRPHVLGLQFDNHAADPSTVATYLQKDQRWLAAVGGGKVDAAAILAESRSRQQEMARNFRQIFLNFLTFTG